VRAKKKYQKKGGRKRALFPRLGGRSTDGKSTKNRAGKRRRDNDQIQEKRQGRSSQEALGLKKSLATGKGWAQRARREKRGDDYYKEIRWGGMGPVLAYLRKSGRKDQPIVKKGTTLQQKKKERGENRGRGQEREIFERAWGCR